MLCVKPIDLGNVLRPCGQCMSCRINAKRKWTARILLESFFHFQSIFVTLTYNPENLPISEVGEATLNPTHLRAYMKKFRTLYSGENGAVRFFACGEYGKATKDNGYIERPHYHLILFGVNINAAQMIQDAWTNSKGETMGFTSLGELNADRAAYIAQYTTKKMTKIGDKRLGDRHPEFARMSMRNGIGFPAVGWLANTMSSKSGMESIAEYGDVWNSVRIDGKIWPLCLYLRRKLRSAMGLSQCSRERAAQLDHIDYSTGEVIANKPLPENYGPWADLSGSNVPLNNARKKKIHTAEIPNAEARNEKTNRRRRAKLIEEI